tara:strand:- start:57 stop:689 length:633 start_codon:yes stop_codon:yes gene_type:complete
MKDATYQSWDDKFWLLTSDDKAAYIIKNFKHYFYDSENNVKVTAGETNTHRGAQTYFKKNEARDLEDFLTSYVNSKLKEHNYPFILDDNPFQREALDRPALLGSRWKIQYQPGGWQGAHNHQTAGDQEVDGETYTMISVVTYFNNPGLATQDGYLYSIFPEKDGTMQKIEVEPSAGKVLIMSGNLFHGIYPTSVERNIIVMDFVAKRLEQ